ncbi:zinc finger and BTB domain-containing protein 20-like isoform X2 [Penaeus japonicus]|uniref:zinc finger and BTB domain-containing protein 20-like isoform X2 n=1 Tax=Penaeus japonicus TaxID=27405 RepID=UPI001C70E588|nr:zinc finger and BTB domain-containing protein 20-like isoform X2 [Penaeus japonicus]
MMERYTDATVACDGKFYPVHKLVLSTCSEYFENMFEHTPCKHPVIVLRDVQCDELEAILNYMYAGVVSVAQSDLSRLIKVAELLRIKGLAVSDEPAEAKTSSNDRSGCHAPVRNNRTSPPARSKNLPATTDRVNSPSAKKRKTQESSTPLPPTRGREAEWPQDCSRGEPQNLGRSGVTDGQRMRGNSPGQDPLPLHPETQDIHIKEEIIEISGCSDSDQGDTGLDFTTIAEDNRQPEALNNSCQDEVSLLIPKYESSGLNSQGGGLLITQPMFSDGLGSAMSGSSDMQSWFPEQETASSVVMDGENTSTGDPSLQVRMEGNETSLPGGTGPAVVGTGPAVVGTGPAVVRTGPVVVGTGPAVVGTGPAVVAFLHPNMGTHNEQPPHPIQSGQSSSAQKNSTRLCYKVYNHNVEKPHACPYCDFRATLKSNLRIHIRTHTGEKPYACPFCPQNFTVRCNLKTHLRTHTGEKPFCCPHCTYRCAHKSDLNKHVVTHTS